MEAHIQELLTRFQYSEQLRETAVFRILFGGEEPSQVMADLDIHNSYTLRNWVSLYQRKIQTGLLTLPAMTHTHKQEMQALKQRNAELEQALQQANLLILALNTMVEVAEEELKIPSRKKSGTKQYRSSVTTRLPR
ncbi:MAG: transposase [Hymenobacter sp.]